LLQQLSARLEGTMAYGAPPAGSTGGTKSGQPDLAALIQQIIGLMQAFNPQAATGGTQPGGPTQDQIKQIQQIITLLSTLFGQGGLGPVNGALGQTIGNLLNGKKTAIGIIGAVLTAVLQFFGPALPTWLQPIIGVVASVGTGAAAGTAATGGLAMPIFLAMAAWGILGKFEKWAQGSQLPTK